MEYLQKLYDIAKQTRLNAYAPYSGFKVGAAIRTDKGNIFSGCNVENAAFPCGTCAEAGAISAMVAAGDRKIKEILLIADTNCILPCGNCLQKIAEFCEADTIVYSADLNGIVSQRAFSDLLPFGFSADDITKSPKP